MFALGNHPSAPIVTSCDWCGARNIPASELEVVIVRFPDGSREPEAWCNDCREAAQDHGEYLA